MQLETADFLVWKKTFTLIVLKVNHKLIFIYNWHLQLAMIIIAFSIENYLTRSEKLHQLFCLLDTALPMRSGYLVTPLCTHTKYSCISGYCFTPHTKTKSCDELLSLPSMLAVNRYPKIAYQSYATPPNFKSCHRDDDVVNNKQPTSQSKCTNKVKSFKRNIFISTLLNSICNWLWILIAGKYELSKYDSSDRWSESILNLSCGCHPMQILPYGHNLNSSFTENTWKCISVLSSTFPYDKWNFWIN